MPLHVGVHGEEAFVGLQELVALSLVVLHLSPELLDQLHLSAGAWQLHTTKARDHLLLGYALLSVELTELVNGDLLVELEVEGFCPCFK